MHANITPTSIKKAAKIKSEGPVPMVVDARIDFLKKGFDPYAYYIVILHGGQEFVGSKGYTHHGNAERFAKKMGFSVVPDGLDALMGK